MSLLGGSFTKSNQSTTNNSTTNNYTDTSANAGGDNSTALGANAQFAGAGGLSVGQGANVAITTSDPSTVAAALHTVEANNQLSAEQYAASLNALAGTQLVSANSNKSTQDAANLAIQSTQSLAAQLAGAGSLQTPASSVTNTQTMWKYGSIVAGLVLAAVVAFFLFKKGSK